LVSAAFLDAFLTLKTSESDLTHKIAFVHLEVFFPMPLTLTQSKFCTEIYGQNSTQRSVAEPSGRTMGIDPHFWGIDRRLLALDRHFGRSSALFCFSFCLMNCSFLSHLSNALDLASIGVLS
jgi:hypothetical protein